MSAPQSSTVSTRFLILSDTHNFDINDINLDDHPVRKSLPCVDVVLHCGDLTHCGGISSYRKAIKLLGSIDAKLKLVIGGNHDLELDHNFWNTHLDEGDEPEDHEAAMEVMKGRLAEETGVVYLEEGTHTFILDNDATLIIYASPYTPAFNDWAFAYEHDQDRFSKPQDTLTGCVSIAQHPIPNLGEIDVVMTHGPPKGILDQCPQGNVGCSNLLQAITRAKPLLHCFGHIHEGSGAMLMNWDSSKPCTRDHLTNTFPEPLKQEIVPGETSLMVNAAINDGANTPANVPWLVDLLLPKVKYEKAV
ncbi:MAG: hypothetical protein Q9188_002091 [Gyalolechia gomerana]